jgi:hypothetical protein
MEGGVISGNTASSYGGGVFVYGTFTKTGGIIYGSNASAALKNTSTSGDSYGHVAYFSGSPSKKRNTTAGENVNLNSGTTSDWE